MSNIIVKKDFVELKYTGKANGVVFDSNIEEDLKNLNPKIKPKKTIVVVGEEMLLKGLDEALEGKEIGREYEITLPPKKAFGERNRSLLKTIPLSVFTEKKINPYPGMVLNLDNLMARIITVSGARVITDLNNPLAGKEIHYRFTITRKVTDEKEKVESLFEIFLKFIPEFEIKDKIILKGPKSFEVLIKELSPKFKDLLGKDLIFEEISKSLSKKSDLDDAQGSKNLDKKEEKKQENTIPLQ